MTTTNQQLNLPAGFRFHPTDEELVVHYLIRKCAGQQISTPIVAEIDLYKFDPWQLPGKALYGEKEWYFFSPRDRKYPNGSRPNRAAGAGYWKATGADKPVGKPKTLGIKKSLVFYDGKAPKGVKTNWIMHEYRLANVDRSVTGKKGNSKLDDWVLCRIYNKKGTIEKHDKVVEQSDVWLSDSEEEKPNVDATLALQMIDDYLHSDTNGLGHTSHTDSSSEENVSSPQLMTGMGVPSGQANWGGFGVDLDFQLDFFDGLQYDPKVTQMQYNDQLSMFQDMFPYTKAF